MKYIIYILIFVSLAGNILAQDIHFSQFNMSPGNLNPAFTGMFDGDYRGVANYRSQWSSVPVSYATVSLQADSRQELKKNINDKVGAGLLFNNDVAGDSKYSTTQLYIPVSYIHQFGSDSGLIMSVGLQPGISNIGFKTNKLSFDSQWDGDAYNSALSTGENFPLQKRTYFDVNTGVVLQYKLKERSAITGGIALSHLTAPKVSYFKNDEIRLDRKLNTYLSYTYPIAPKLDLTAEYMLEKQGKYVENVLGAKISYILPTKEPPAGSLAALKNKETKQSLNAGIYLRTKDAPIFRVGYDINQWQFGMSYDLNTSKFKVATNRRGAIEFGLIYIFKKDKPFVPKKRACPVYM